MTRRLNDVLLERGRLLERITTQRYVLINEVQPVHATLDKVDHFRAQVQLGVEIPQCGAQPLFDHRVVEGHVQHLADGHLLLVGPGQQVSDVLDIGSHHLGAEETAGAMFAINVQQAFVA